ncbi:hypothetical protein [Cryobacterium sp. Y50]|uniref:hypothetical protein n=1 Tax=Cryobacterium sp. Y50 TaxID=2048286 RepID=UPI000CE47757|nr:hypothetical protein [Cryobacterium sp. Y50]
MSAAEQLVLPDGYRQGILPCHRRGYDLRNFRRRSIRFEGGEHGNVQRPVLDGEALAGLKWPERQNDNEMGHAPIRSRGELLDRACITAEIIAVKGRNRPE